MDDANDNLNIGLMGLFVGIVAVIFLVLAIIGGVLIMVLAGGEPTAVQPLPTAAVAAAVQDTADAETEVMDSADSTNSEATTITTTDEPINRLVVVTADNQLLTVSPDGSNPIELTTADDAVTYLFPAWSPDSRNIAAIGSGRGAAEPDGIFIFEDSAESAANRVHTQTQTPIYLYWSPDSSEVSFITTRVDDSTLLDLRIVPRDGSDRSRFMAFGQPFYWDYSSTGDEMIISTNRSTHSEFAYITLADGDIGEQLDEVSPYFQSPDLSFDDAYLAYAIGDQDDREVIIVERSSGEQQVVPHFGQAVFSWSPVANQLAFASPSRNVRSPIPFGPLRILDTDGSVQTLVDDDVFSFFWSPDGSKIVYFTFDSANNTQEATFNRSRRASLVAQQQAHPQLSLWALDVATTERTLLGSFLPSEMFVLQFLPFFDQYAHSHTFWAPDSSAVALPLRNEDGNSSIYRFALDGSRPTLIAEGKLAFWSRR